MKKIFITGLLFLFSVVTWSQKDSVFVVNIEYNYVVRGNVAKNITFKGAYDLFLLPDYGMSVFDKDESKSVVLNKSITDSNIATWIPKGNNLSTLFKNYVKNEMFLKRDINFRFFVQKDSLTIFDWDIKEEKKTILGYNCQAAKTTFRGRIYEAWFTTALPVSGPWKFDGLPGAILEVNSLDEYVNWTAVAVVAKNQKPDFAVPDNPFLEDKALTWSEFKTLYKEKAIAASKYVTKEGDKLNIVTPRMGIERYIEEDDKDYQADKVLKKMGTEAINHLYK
jgi:GLPGLI family protein